MNKYVEQQCDVFSSTSVFISMLLHLSWHAKLLLLMTRIPPVITCYIEQNLEKYNSQPLLIKHLSRMLKICPPDIAILIERDTDIFLKL